MSKILIESTVNVRSFSIIWNIKNYSRLHMEKGERLLSPDFIVGKNNVKWHIEMYPEGREDANDGYLSIYLYNESELNYSTSYEISILTKSEDKMFTFKDKKRDFRKGWGKRVFATKAIVFDKKDELLYMDTLTINVELELTEGITNSTPANLEIEPDSNIVLTDLLNLFNSSILSDLEIRVKERSFQVHKNILAARSPVFAAMFSHDLLENKTNILTIEDADPEVMEVVLLYIYSGKCDGLECLAEAVLPISEKYSLEHLKTLCEYRLCSQLNAENLINFLTLAQTYNLKHLKKRSMDLICIEGYKILQSPEWEQLTSDNKDLALEVLSYFIRINHKAEIQMGDLEDSEKKRNNNF